MTKFACGMVVGIVLATVGFSGITRLLDRGVQSFQQQTKELAQ